MPVRRSGSISAADMLRDPTSANKPEIPRSASPMVDLTRSDASKDGVATPTTPMTPTARDAQLNPRLYHFFIAACTQSMTFQLSKASLARPINFRTVILMSEHSHADLAEFSDESYASMAGLDVSLTSQGVVLVSTHLVVDAMRLSLSDLHRNADNDATLVRLAPSGRLARRLTRIAPAGELAGVTSDHTSSDKAGFSVSWRSMICSQLHERGIMLQAKHDDDLAWCRIRLLEFENESAMQQRRVTAVLDSEGAFEWPAELCFEHNRDRDIDGTEFDKAHTGTDAVTSWFDDDNGASMDVIDEALQLCREEDFKRILKAKAADIAPGKGSLDKLAVPQPEPEMMDWEPPAVQLLPQDLEKMAAVYPTPPDGLIVPNTTISTTTGTSGQAGQSTSVPGIVPRDNDEDFGVTEADFSFFDEPVHERVVDTSSGNAVQVQAPIVDDMTDTSTTALTTATTTTVVDDARLEASSNPKTHQPKSVSFSGTTDFAGDATRDDLIPHGKPTTAAATTSKYARDVQAVSSMVDIDDKYSMQGRFAYDIQKTLAKGESNRPSKQALQVSVSDPVALSGEASYLKRRASRSRPVAHQGYLSPDDSSSEDDGCVGSESEAPSKRRKGPDESRDHAEVASDQAQQGPTQAEATKILQYMFLQLICRTVTTDWSLTNLPAPWQRGEAAASFSYLESQTFIGAAQTFCQQLSSYEYLFTQGSKDSMLSSRDSSFGGAAFHNFSQALGSCIHLALGLTQSAVQQSLVEDAALEGVMRQVAVTKFQPKTGIRRTKTLDAQTTSRNVSGTSIYRIEPPLLRVTRSDETSWELLPTAIPFWETLGLAPASGAKNVSAVCVLPQNATLVDRATNFLRLMESAWKDHRLGAHEPLQMPLQSSRVIDGLACLSLEACGSLAETTIAYRDAILDIGSSLVSCFGKQY